MDNRYRQRPLSWPAGPLRVGWLCSYTPEELLMAAGLEPLRLAGDFSQEGRVKAAYASSICPYLRGALGEGLRQAGGLAGLVAANACDGMRRLADVWPDALTGSFAYLLDVPRRTDEAAVRYFVDCLRGLRRFLEERTGGVIFDDSLAEAIARQNRLRRALSRMADQRRQGRSPMRARAFYDLVWRAGTEPKVPFLARLEAEVVEGTKGPPSLPEPPQDSPRLVLSGNILAPADYAILDLVEECGARIAADDLCTGERYFLREVEEQGDPLAALARRYLLRTPCARMANATERADALLQICRDARADGVLYLSQKFCDAFLYEFAYCKARLEAEGRRVLLLELDGSQSMAGQARTRVQAFLETL